MALKPISDASQFAQEIASGPVIVDFWAPWCGPCKALALVLEEMSVRHPGIRFLKVNADEPGGGEISASCGVSSLPTLLLFKNGTLVNKMVGNTSGVRDFIETAY
jgi:thioredoxin 1